MLALEIEAEEEAERLKLVGETQHIKQAQYLTEAPPVME